MTGGILNSYQLCAETEIVSDTYSTTAQSLTTSPPPTVLLRGSMTSLPWSFTLRVSSRASYRTGADRANKIDWMVFWDDGVSMRMKGYNKIQLPY